MAKKEIPLKDQNCIADVEAHIEQCQKAIEKLERAADLLPKVDNEGHSDCAVAEELYAQKEEAQQEATGYLQELDEDRLWVDQEISGCHNDLMVMTAHQEKLHSDSPRAHFNNAEAKIAGTLHHLEKVRDEIEALFEQMQDIIKKASQKIYPGKIPVKNPHFAVVASQPSTRLDNDLKALIQQGPVQ